MTKRVGTERKRKRAGDGVSPVRVAFTENHFRAAVRKAVWTDGSSPLKERHMIEC